LNGARNLGATIDTGDCVLALSYLPVYQHPHGFSELGQSSFRTLLCLRKLRNLLGCMCLRDFKTL